MPLSLNEIKDRALAFSREWTGERSEKAEAQTFWNEFFNVFGVTRRRLASFEEPVRRARTKFEAKGGKGGFIDLFWRGMLIAEHKSLGRDLDSAYEQALEYFEGLAERDLPRYVIVSDFARIRLYDLDSGTEDEFPLKDLYRNIRLFGFIAGYTTQRITAQDPVNIKAAERMGRLHDRLRSAGYRGHALEVLLVRLLFCLFAEDTSLYERGSFRDFLENSTREDGSDLGPRLMHLFQVLNTPESGRQTNLDEGLAAFPYVNGKLFEEALPIPACDAAMRGLLLDCCALDWGKISPAIFGALFQCVMDEEGSSRRRNLGAHYTSEENILKLINPLFLDGLRAEFESAKRSTSRLFELLKKIERLKFLDPACGCGNFLVIAYRELRELELEILRAARATGQRHLDIFQLVQVSVSQFHGIEIEEFPAQIAQVALWLTDHQMNMKVSEEFGQYFRRLPLIDSAKIVCGNALRMDWNEVISAEQVDYILGNPPFVGAMHMSTEQRKDLVGTTRSEMKNAGILDYVSAWYLKTVGYLRGSDSSEALLNKISGNQKTPRERVKAAFVSTNSITQGEQVGILWTELLRLGVKIHFAHRTFQWSNEARGKAAVHCVIIGFAFHDTDRKVIYDYPDISAAPHAMPAFNINPYLVDAPDVLLANRSKPIVDVPSMKFGSMPRDGGHLLFTEEEKTAFLKLEPRAAKWMRPYIGSQEFINGEQRWCLWLIGIDPSELRSMPHVMKRIEAVRNFRLSSKAAATQKFAQTPTLFCQIAQPDSDYLLIPGVSSEKRQYIPIGFMHSDVIANNLVFVVPNALLFHFGVLSSSMHMAWVRYVCGRLESRYRYSKDIVYNNFPWPEAPTEKQKSAIEAAAQAVLDARSAHPEASLADLYDPIAMPPDLRRAHQALDRAVDAAYGKKAFSSDAERVAFLFELYHRYTSLFPAPAKPKKRKKPAPSFA